MREHEERGREEGKQGERRKREREREREEREKRERARHMDRHRVFGIPFDTLWG